MLFAPGAPREHYFEGIAKLGDMTYDERREWFIANDNYFVDRAGSCAERYGAVRLWLSSATCAGVPAATTRPPASAGTWAEVDHPIGACHQSHVVFGDDHGVARVDEAVQLTIQQIHVGGMQAGGGLVEHIERVPAGPTDRPDAFVGCLQGHPGRRRQDPIDFGLLVA
jgi:hypothetical protein